MDRKNAVRSAEEQESCNTLINTSLKRAKRDKNLTMAWIDYKKSYDMVSQSWIIEYLKMYKILGDVRKFIKNTKEIWSVEQTAGRKS